MDGFSSPIPKFHYEWPFPTYLDCAFGCCRCADITYWRRVWADQAVGMKACKPIAVAVGCTMQRLINEQAHCYWDPISFLYC